MDLHEAIHLRSVPDMLNALNRGADVNTLDEYGRCPLRYACHTNIDMAEILIMRGADMKQQWGDFGATPLHVAPLYIGTVCTELLLRHKADVNARNWRHMTPLHNAATGTQESCRKCIVLLLEHKADPSARNINGQTALQLDKMNDEYTHLLQVAESKQQQQQQ